MAREPLEWYPINVCRGFCRGFSLAELMVALMILSVVSLILSGLIPATIVGMAKAAKRANAGIIADNRLAQMQQAGFGNLSPTAPPHETLTVEKTDYNLQVLIDKAKLSNGTDMDDDVAKMVSVVVRWKDRNGDQKHVSRAVIFKRI